MPHDTQRRCCDGLCQQGRRCPGISAAIFAPTYERAADMPRQRNWLRIIARLAARRLRRWGLL